jgi:glycosyltransferase involved in cell wall biosynthesis
MRIGFSENLDKLDGSGKHKFLYRLKTEFERMGVSVVNKNPHIYLLLPGHSIKKGAKNILRLNGIIIDNKVDRSKNKSILKLAHKSDGVVYQNKFCMQAYERFLGLNHRNSACISNGASPEEFLPRSPQKIFLASCRWRPHKRLDDIISGYLKSKKFGLQSNLIVAGKLDGIKHKINKNPGIKYVGWQNSAQLNVLLSQSLASLHLSWIDWCPNSMVESIVAGCPVIYSDSGGHSYIADKCGIPIRDQQWNFKPCDYYNPPRLDVTEIANAMIEMENKPISIVNGNLYISFVAKEYLSFFLKVLDES